MLELRLLHYFVAVAETEHVGRAAERLHVSQSPLSRQVRQLEGLLGLRLFDRERQRVRLTDEGRWLLGQAREVIARAERMERDAARMAQGEVGRVTVGFVKSSMWSHVLPQALRRFRALRPAVRVELRTMRSADQAEAILRGDIDLGLVHAPPEAAILDTECLLDESFVLAMPRSHPLAKKKAIAARDLDARPWVTLSRREYPLMYDRLVAACGKAGFTPDVTYDASEPSTVLGLVEAGMGLALLQESVQRVAPREVVLRELPWFGFRLRTHLVWRAVGLPAPAAELVESLRREGKGLRPRLKAVRT